MNGDERRPAGERLDDLPRILEDSLSAYYARDAASLVDRIAKGCTTIVASGEMFCGRQELQEALPRLLADPPMRLEEADFRLTDVADDDAGIAVVVGSYRLFTAIDTPLIFSTARQATACFRRREDGGWSAHHLHFSNAGDRQVEKSRFPIETSRETYDYVRRILGAARKNGILPSRIVIRDNTQRYYLDPDDILYIEAQGKRCMARGTKWDLPFGKLLSEIEMQLPGIFVRTHRSYLVNATHVRSIERYAVVLSDGTRLPIPKRRYDQVRNEIALRVAES